MANKYLDSAGLTYFWQKIKTFFTGTATPLMDNSNGSVGTSSKLAREDHVHPSDTTRVSVTQYATDQTAINTAIDNLDAALANKATNAFSNVKVGTTTIAADSKADTLELVAGSNVTLTPDATNDKVTIKATDTTYSAFTGATTSAAGTSGLVPAPAKKTSANKFLYLSDSGSWNIPDAESIQYVIDPSDTSGSADNISNVGTVLRNAVSNLTPGAEANQNAFGKVTVGSTTIAADAEVDTLTLVAGSNVTLTPDATNDKVTIAATDTTYSALTATDAQAGTATTGRLITAKVMANEIDRRINVAKVGAMMFQGIADSVAGFNAITGYKAGYYWIVGTAGTYANSLVCEVGDMIVAVSDYSSSMKDTDFKVIQGNIPGPMTTSDIDAAIAAA